MNETKVLNKSLVIDGLFHTMLANEAVICGLTPEKACNIKEFAA